LLQGAKVLTKYNLLEVKSTSSHNITRYVRKTRTE